MTPTASYKRLASLITAAAGLLCRAQALERLEPAEGCYVGVSLEARDTIDAFSTRIGLRPAVYGDFFEFPLTEQGRAALAEFFRQIQPTRGIALVTLEPYGGLSNVTEQACLDFAQLCSEQERQGIGGILVRFGHEMNGNWNPWGQQPLGYKEKFRLLSGHVHSQTARTAMLWAPSYGGGYPFGGQRVTAGSPDFNALDTDGDGILSQNDDSYEPYYPGDDAADWVGLTVYHWGVQYPWLENEVPETNSFANLLTGKYSGGNGDQSAVPDFYARYCTAAAHNKPLAIPETAAFFNPHQGGASELAIKQAWCRQLFNISGDSLDALDVALHFPKLKCIAWFEHYKLEPEQKQWIDWRISIYRPVRSAFVSLLRTLRNGQPWFLTAPAFDHLGRRNWVMENGLPEVLPLRGSVTLDPLVQTQTGSNVVVELLNDQLRPVGATRAPVQPGLHLVRLEVPLDQPLSDGATYRFRCYLIRPGGSETNPLARYDTLPVFARGIVPAIQIVASPPGLVWRSNITVRVQWAAERGAVAVVNLLDASYQWRGGGQVSVSRGNGVMDVPIVLQPRLPQGNYLLEAFISDSSTNWQKPMARSTNVPVRVSSTVKQETISAVALPAVIPAGEVFRFSVAYAAATNRDLHIDFFDANTNFLAGALQPVAAGTGTCDMTISFPEAAPGQYLITVFMTPTGKSWQEAVTWGASRVITVVGQEYQQFIQSHWGLVLFNDLVSPHDDPDGDGASNEEEFAAFTDPRDPADVFRSQMTRTRRGAVLTWTSHSGRQYRVLQSSECNAGIWTPLTSWLPGTGAMLQAEFSREDAVRFYRVEVSP